MTIQQINSFQHEYEDIHNEIITELDEGFLNSIKDNNEKIDVEKLLNLFVATMHRINIQRTSAFDEKKFEVQLIEREKYDSLSGGYFEYEKTLENYEKDPIFKEKYELLKKEGKEPLIIDSLGKILLRTTKFDKSINRERIALALNIKISDSFNFVDIPNLIVEIEKTYKEKYKEKGVVPEGLDKLLKIDLDKLHSSLEILSKELEDKSKTILSRLQLQQGTEKDKKLRRNMSKKAFFYFCLSKTLLGENAFSKEQTSKYSELFKEFIKQNNIVVIKNNEQANNNESNKNLLLQTNAEDKVNKGKFKEQAEIYINSKIELNMTDFDIFTDEIIKFFKSIPGDLDNSLREKYKSDIINTITPSKIKKLADGNYEKHSDYVKRIILEIAESLDKVIGNVKIDEMKVGELGLKQDSKNYMKDLFLDGLERRSEKEVVREGDIIQVVSKNFGKVELENIAKEKYIDLVELKKKLGIKGEFFENIEIAKVTLENENEKLKNAKSVEEKEKIKESINEIEYKISVQIAIIVYSKKFYSYSKRNFSIASNNIVEKKVVMCMGQGLLMKSALEGIFGIETYGVWLSKEDFGHYITVLKGNNKRTDILSAFNDETETTISSTASKKGYQTNDVTDSVSIERGINTNILGQVFEKNRLNSLEKEKYDQEFNSQVVGLPNSYSNLGIDFLNNGNNEDAYINLKKQEALINENYPFNKKVNIYFRLGMILSNNRFDLKESIKYFDLVINEVINKINETSEFKEDTFEFLINSINNKHILEKRKVPNDILKRIEKFILLNKNIIKDFIKKGLIPKNMVAILKGIIKK